MGQVRHGSATTTHAIRATIQRSQTTTAALTCAANEIKHRLTKPNHPWTNGQVERMNRTIKDATVKRYHYDSHDQLRRHLSDFLDAYNYARRLKTLSGLTPYEYICKIWTSEPDRFILNPIHQMPGLNTQRLPDWHLPACAIHANQNTTDAFGRLVKRLVQFYVLT